MQYLSEVKMDHINFIPLSDHCTVKDRSEEQMRDVAYQYGEIKNIFNFDSPTKFSKWTELWIM